MKKLVFLVVITATFLLFIACGSSTGYVENEPTYVEMARPASPDPNYVWINGNWVWDGRNGNYYRTDGYWAQPRNGQTYVDGYWTRDSRGYYWTEGRWK
jgi:hypothetical protein